MRPASILVPTLIALLVAACGAVGGATAPAPFGGSAAAATAQPRPAAPALEQTADATTAPAAPPAKEPTCEQVLTPGELAGISTVDGWVLTSWDDVMPDTDVTCQWDFKLNTSEWLHAEVHFWSGNQAARFMNGGLPGEAVEGLGDAAGWDPIGGRLLVKIGNRVLGVVPGSLLGPDGQEAGAIAIAYLVIPRIRG